MQDIFKFFNVSVFEQFGEVFLDLLPDTPELIYKIHYEVIEQLVVAHPVNFF